MADNAQVIRDFVAAWERLDADEIAGYFTEDGTYHNIPVGPVSGRANVRELIAGFINDWTATNWDVLTLVESGDTVVAERVDHIHMGEKQVDLPCLGIFEMEGGKIKVWRDYFDLGTYMQGAG